MDDELRPGRAASGHRQVVQSGQSMILAGGRMASCAEGGSQWTLAGSPGRRSVGDAGEYAGQATGDARACDGETDSAGVPPPEHARGYCVAGWQARDYAEVSVMRTHSSRLDSRTSVRPRLS